ncbi:MAG: MerR family transcriptional regulator, partial [Rickettsiales bacterium]|nr:MerR family transcriptional regulator [Rickettsiales bacterium]
MNEKLISITDVSKRLGLPAHTLRYWEREFPRIVRPTAGNGGRRYYTPAMVEKLAEIKSLLHDKKYTVAGVKKMFARGEWNQEPATSN